MSKRLQVLLDDAEYSRFQRLAKRLGLSVAEWVRQALRAAYREEPLGSTDKKLAVVRAAARLEFPTADIDQMLDEISAGYGLPEP
jgi:hypothetical protein